jgi:hypothetical protein
VKITTKKIMRELEKKGWHNANGEWNEIDIDLIKAVRDIIDEFLKQHKNISINGK